MKVIGRANVRDLSVGANDKNTAKTAISDFYLSLPENDRMEIKERTVAFLVIPEATLLDITGPFEVFSQANEYLQAQTGREEPAYVLRTLSAVRGRSVRTASGLVIECEGTIRGMRDAVDTLFVPGVPNGRLAEYRVGNEVLQWIKGQAERANRICSVCTGTFLLAQAGVLHNKKATTHWEKCATLSREYPDVEVDHDSIFVKDGTVYTSAGISAGMDLALALVEEDWGRDVALEIAKQMVLYLKRPGSQSQYSSVLTHQRIDYRPVRGIINWISEHLHEQLTVELLAEQSAMSVRNFSRVFTRETGVTPARFIDKLRVERACRYLLDTRLSLKEIAVLSGLGSIDNMRKVFLKYMAISPAKYRAGFRTAFPDK
ncbi:GlxA family transcriptional regulator [Parabacteroides sp. OttesenSCG-928-G07]|nr:GlxA family transcriptional regulator [Parabacteroides sp. OttesenSCG-928-G21]MDL2278633.1 GlxA family transcriptional regulator [Parabacteroides sp. OttesenSCG-928-G07]